MPGQYHLSVDSLVERAAAAHAAGVPAVILFGLPARKDEAASEAFDDEGIVQMGIRALRAHVPDLVVVTDVCLCQYTSHGHCGILQDGEVANDVSLEVLADTAVSHARAGADIVAPSDMMDGRVGAIRSALDAEGFEPTSILAYSAKFASRVLRPVPRRRALGPERGRPARLPDGPGERPRGRARGAARHRRGRRHGHGQARAAVPGRAAHVCATRPGVPLAAYQVSGEYAMLKAAAAQGLVDERAAVLEALTAIRRAGADMIITYYAGSRGAVAVVRGVAHGAPLGASSSSRRARLIPGGVSSPVRALRVGRRRPSALHRPRRGRLGVGRRRQPLRRLGQSWGPLIAGHAHPGVVDAMHEAAAGRAPPSARRPSSRSSSPGRSSRPFRRSSRCGSSPPAPRPR